MPSAAFRPRTFLLAGASALALMVASPEQAHSADVPARMIAKAPPVVAPAPQWEWFIEGAGFSTRGEPVWTEVPFFQARSFKPRFGWEAAAGFDYRFANSPWHVSAQIRYGAAKSANRRFLDFDPGCVINCTTEASTARHKEQHWAADFMVGRDLAMAHGQHQVKVGVRVAELDATTSASGESDGSIGFASRRFTQRSEFHGVGPRVALEGNVPLGGAWSFDYGLGAAVLFGDRDLALNGSGVSPIGGPFTNSIRSPVKDGKVYNLDAMGGLSYQFTPNFKFIAGYRFDGYWNALHTWNSDFEFVNADRFFHGPFVRATARY